MKKFIFGFVSLFALQTFAVECSYQVYTPEFVYSRLVHELANQGLGKILTSEVDDQLDFEGGELIVRGAGGVGFLVLKKDDFGKESELKVFDGFHRNLLTVRETRFPLRSEIEIFTDGSNSSPILTILRSAHSGTGHYVGASDLGITIFRSTFEEQWSRLMRFFLDPQHVGALTFKSALDRFQFQLKTQPTLMPYAPGIMVSTAGSRVRISGVVGSHGAYHSLVSLAHQEFGYGAVIQVVIDQHFAFVPVPPACYEPLLYPIYF